MFERKTKQKNGVLWLLVLLLAVVAALMLFLPDGTESVPDADTPTEEPDRSEYELVEAGDPAPDFTLEVTDGSTVTLSELRGKVVLLSFWATWCPYCLDELTDIQARLLDRFDGAEFAFVAVSKGDTPEKIAATCAQKGFTFPSAMDRDSKVFESYAKKGLPHTYLIDREGKVVTVWLGYDADELPDLLAQTEQTIKTK